MLNTKEYVMRIDGNPDFSYLKSYVRLIDGDVYVKVNKPCLNWQLLYGQWLGMISHERDISLLAMAWYNIPAVKSAIRELESNDDVSSVDVPIYYDGRSVKGVTLSKY